jgi:hypothetical protein
VRRLAAFVLLLASLYALAWAVALARVPLGEDIAFAGGRGSCATDWVERVQLVPALAALVASALALLRRSWPLAATILLVGWFLLMGAAECGIGYDE